jgi:hypothetical protein
MPRVFFHLCDDRDVLLDEEGIEMDLAAVPARALSTAREIICHDAMGGRINLGYSIEVRDETGKTLHTTRFREAVRIDGYEPRPQDR